MPCSDSRVRHLHECTLAQMNGEAAQRLVGRVPRHAAAQRAPILDRPRCRTNNMAAYWVDLNRQGQPTDYGDKSVVLISRSLWSFSEAYRRYPDPAYQTDGGGVFEVSARQDVGQGAWRLLLHGDPRRQDHRFDEAVESHVVRDGGTGRIRSGLPRQKAVPEAMDLFRVIDQHAHDTSMAAIGSPLPPIGNLSKLQGWPEWRRVIWAKILRLALRVAGSVGYALRRYRRLAGDEPPGTSSWTYSSTRSSTPMSVTAATTSTMTGVSPIATVTPSSPNMVWILRPAG